MRNSIKKSLTPSRTELKNVYLILSSMAVVMIIMMGIVYYLPNTFADTPDIPQLTVSSIGEDEVELTWTSSTSGSGGHSFDLFRCEGISCTPTVQVGNNVDSPYQDQGLTAETDYCWVIEESHGQTTTLSNIVCATTTAFQGGEPDVTIFAVKEGKSSIMVTWLLPITEKGNGFVYFYDILRSDDGGQNYILIGQQTRDVVRTTVDHDNDYREIYNYLDQDLDEGDIKQYKVLVRTSSGGGQGNIKYEVDSNSIEIPFTLSGYLIKSDGYGIETETSGNPQPPLMLGWFAWFMPEVFGVGNPIFTSMFNPQNEVFEIDIEPIPIPTYDQEICEQFLDVGFKRSSDSGQTIRYTITVLENDVPRHQFSDTIQITAKRVFNNQYFIPFNEQVITDFENISIQIDVDSEVGDPRAFELYTVDFYTPEDNGAC